MEHPGDLWEGTRQSLVVSEELRLFEDRLQGVAPEDGLDDICSVQAVHAVRSDDAFLNGLHSAIDLHKSTLRQCISQEALLERWRTGRSVPGRL